MSAHQDIWKDIWKRVCVPLYIVTLQKICGSRSVIPEATLQSHLCLSTASYNLWFLVAGIGPQQISSKSPISIFPQQLPWSQDCGVITIGAAASPWARALMFPLIRAMVLYQGCLCTAAPESPGLNSQAQFLARALHISGLKANIVIVSHS